jgi:hypothetical protein
MKRRREEFLKVVEFLNDEENFKKAYNLFQINNPANLTKKDLPIIYLLVSSDQSKFEECLRGSKE